MPKAAVGGIEIEYERSGDPRAPAMLFIMGLGAQLCGWDDEFIAGFLDRGFQTIRFDNRDTGLSTKWPSDGKALGPLLFMAMQGQAVEAPYELTDMAQDVAGLLDALAIPSCHVVGASMGGMIAQLFALQTPQRVRSLTSIMSTTNDRGLPPPEPHVLPALLAPAGADREARINHLGAVFQTISSRPPLFDAERSRARITRSYDRCFHPAGVGRQLLAVVRTPGRTPALASLRVPTLVIHGDCDPLVPLACGQATAAAIPGARLLVLPGMGHELPASLWPQLFTAITEHAQAAERSFAGPR